MKKIVLFNNKGLVRVNQIKSDLLNIENLANFTQDYNLDKLKSMLHREPTYLNFITINDRPRAVIFDPLVSVVYLGKFIYDSSSFLSKVTIGEKCSYNSNILNGIEKVEFITREEVSKKPTKARVRKTKK